MQEPSGPSGWTATRFYASFVQRGISLPGVKNLNLGGTEVPYTILTYPAMDLAAHAPRGRRRHPRDTQAANRQEMEGMISPAIHLRLTVAALVLSGQYKSQCFPRLPDISHWLKFNRNVRCDWRHRPIGQSRAGEWVYPGHPWFSQVTPSVGAQPKVHGRSGWEHWKPFATAAAGAWAHHSFPNIPRIAAPSVG
jgi:hypothetical protein